MRRATAAQSRRKVRRSQGLFYGLNVDDDPRAVGDAGSNGIRYNTVLENLVPAGNKLVSRRAQLRGTSDNVSQTLQPKLLSVIESWDGSVLSAYIDEGALGDLRITSQTDTNDTGTEVVNIGFTAPAGFKAEFYKISSDKILLATNSDAVGFVLIFDNNGTYDFIRIDGGQDITATIGGASTLPTNIESSYQYNIAFAFSKKDTNGVTISQTPLVSDFELRMDEKFGTGGFDLFFDVTYNPAFYQDYTHIQVWRTTNFSISTGNDNDSAAAGGGDLYYKLVDVLIADISTTDIFPFSDTAIIGSEQKILGFVKMPASNICSVSESFFLAARDERINYTELGSTTIDIGFNYEAFQYFDFDDDVNSLTLSNGWVLVGTTPKTFRWDLITVRDAGVIGENATVGVSIPVMGTPLQASGDIGISLDRANASVVATNGYICSFCADGSVRMFDGATWSGDYTEGKIRSLTINNAITTNAIAGWLPTGEYVLWLDGITLSLSTPNGQTPHRWTIYSDTNVVVLDRDWVVPLVKPIYLGGGNSYNQISPVENRPGLLIANNDIFETESRLIWDNNYPFPPTTATCSVQLGEISGEQWYYFITPEESHIYINNISDLYGDFTLSSKLVSRNESVNPVDITDIVTDAGQITLYPPVDANTKWHSYSILFEITGGDVVINKFDTIAESMDKNNFPTKAVYKPSETIQEFRTPTIQILTGDGPLMTASKNPSDSVYGLLQGENGEVISSPDTITSAGCSVVANDPFGSTNKSVNVVGATELLGKNSGNPLSRPKSTGSRRGLFIPSGSFLDDKTLVLGKNSGWNPLKETRTMSAWWQKKTDVSDSVGETDIFSIGGGYTVIQKVLIVGESKEIVLVTTTGDYLRVPLIDDRTFVVDEWEYYIVESTRVDNGDGSFDDNYKLYRGFANDPTLVLVTELDITDVINTNGPFYFESNSITFRGTVNHSYWDICFFSGLTTETPQELWAVKYNTDNSDWVYNAGNNPNTDKGN